MVRAHSVYFFAIEFLINSEESLVYPRYEKFRLFRAKLKIEFHNAEFQVTRVTIRYQISFRVSFDNCSIGEIPTGNVDSHGLELSMTPSVFA